MYLGTPVQRYLVTVVITVLVRSIQVTAVDEKPIPRISVASGASSGSSSVADAASQGANSPGPPSGANLGSDVTSSPVGGSETNGPSAPSGPSDGGGQASAADQEGQSNTEATQKSNENSESKAEPAFSITEVTKPDTVSSPEAPEANKKGTIPRINVSVTKNANVATDTAKPEEPTPSKEGDGDASTDKPVTDEQPEKATGIVAPTITEIIQPVAGVDSGASTKESEHEDQSVAAKGVKDPVLKINAAVGNMIKPVAGAAATKPETAVQAQAGDGVGQGVTTTSGTKVDGSVASSGSTEDTVHQPPETPVQSVTPEADKDISTKRSAPEKSPIQSLNTLITPVQSIQPEKDAVSSTTPTQEKGTETGSSDKKPNAYTITSHEFAQKTADAHAQKSGEEAVGTGENSRNPKYESGKGPTNVPNTNVQSTSAQGEINGGDPNSPNTSPGTEVDVANSKNEKETEPKKTASENVQEIPLKSSNRNDNFNLLGFLEQAESLIKEFQSFKEDLDEKWNERKRKASWLGGAFGELHGYHEKILETKVYSKCSSNDLLKYNEKMKILDEIMNECESTMKRTDWLELQEKINKLIGEIRDVVKYFNDQKININKEDEKFEELTLSLEKEAKKKLQNINTDTIMDELTELKNKVLTSYENDYTSCIDKPDKASRGAKIVSEAQQSVMDIYACIESNNKDLLL